MKHRPFLIIRNYITSIDNIETINQHDKQYHSQHRAKVMIQLKYFISESDDSKNQNAKVVFSLIYRSIPPTPSSSTFQKADFDHYYFKSGVIQECIPGLATMKPKGIAPFS